MVAINLEFLLALLRSIGLFDGTVKLMAMRFATLGGESRTAMASLVG
jgi:hypothetical protein